MTGAALLDTLAARGVVCVISEAGGLELDAPPGALDTELLEALRSHKVEVLALLSEQTSHAGETSQPSQTPETSQALPPTAQNTDAYVESIALTMAMLAAAERLAAVSPPTDPSEWDAAHQRYQAAGSALLDWMAATKSTDPAMVDETWTALHARLEALRSDWRARAQPH